MLFTVCVDFMLLRKVVVRNTWGRSTSFEKYRSFLISQVAPT